MTDDMLSAEGARKQFKDIVKFLRQPGVIEANYDVEYVESVLKEHTEFDTSPVIIGKND